MPTLLIPVGLLASNPWVVILFVFVALYCILLYVLEYLDKKNLPGDRRGTLLFAFWFLISLLFVILLVIYQTLIITVIFIGLLMIPIIIRIPSHSTNESPGSWENTQCLVRVLLGAGAIIGVLILSILSTHGFGLFSGMGVGSGSATGFEMQILDSTGVPHTIMGASGINHDASKVMSDNGNWSLYLLFTDTGEIAYQEAIIESGASENSDEHPLSLVVDGEVIVSTTLGKEYAERVKTQRMRAVTIFIGEGTSGRDNATRILNSLK